MIKSNILKLVTLAIISAIFSTGYADTTGVLLGSAIPDDLEGFAKAKLNSAGSVPFIGFGNAKEPGQYQAVPIAPKNTDVLDEINKSEQEKREITRELREKKTPDKFNFHPWKKQKEREKKVLKSFRDYVNGDSEKARLQGDQGLERDNQGRLVKNNIEIDRIAPKKESRNVDTSNLIKTLGKEKGEGGKHVRAKKQSKGGSGANSSNRRINAASPFKHVVCEGGSKPKNTRKILFHNPDSKKKGICHFLRKIVGKKKSTLQRIVDGIVDENKDKINELFRRKDGTRLFKKVLKEYLASRKEILSKQEAKTIIDDIEKYKKQLRHSLTKEETPYCDLMIICNYVIKKCEQKSIEQGTQDLVLAMKNIKGLVDKKTNDAIRDYVNKNLEFTEVNISHEKSRDVGEEIIGNEEDLKTEVKVIGKTIEDENELQTEADEEINEKIDSLLKDFQNLIKIEQDGQNRGKLVEQLTELNGYLEDILEKMREANSSVDEKQETLKRIIKICNQELAKICIRSEYTRIVEVLKDYINQEKGYGIMDALFANKKLDQLNKLLTEVQNRYSQLLAGELFTEKTIQEKLSEIIDYINTELNKIDPELKCVSDKAEIKSV